ncbi:MAG: glycosyltransferase family 39 protein [Candidatus Omnitrophota bacterium]
MINKLIERPLYAVLTLAVLSFYLFFFQLGSMPLTDPDETFYAQTSREMVDRGEWATPYLHGKPQFEKPILFYWLVNVSYKVFGVNEAAARLPSAVLGFIGILLVYLLSAALFDKKAALLSGVIMAANVEYVILSRACVTDMALSVFILAGLLAFVYAYQRKLKFMYVAAAFFFGLATLTKGPIGLLLPGVIIVGCLLLERDAKELLRVPYVRCILVFLAVSMPWYILVYRLHGSEFVNEFFGFHNIVRFLEPEHKIGSQFYFYIPIVFVELFPWCVFLPLAMFFSLRRAKDRGNAREASAHTLLWVWFAVFFVFFSVSRTKLVTYIFPGLHPLAIMIGAMWADFLEKKPTVPKKWMNASFVLMFVAAIVGSVVAGIVVGKRYPAVLAGTLIGSAALSGTLIISVVMYFRGLRGFSFLLIALAVVMFIYPLHKFILPEVGLHETSRKISEELSKILKKGDRVGSESHYRSGVAFYTGQRVADLDTHHNLTVFLGSSGRGYGVLKEKNFVQLYTLDDRPYYKKPTYMVYKLGRKKCIVTNMIPEDGKYLRKMER